MKPATLHLENGSLYHGFSPLWQEETYYGEVVFSTGMTGYVESLTDPSYAGQILLFTYPLIGNYGVVKKSLWESKTIHASAVVVSSACDHWSHSQGQHSFKQWLEQQGVPLIEGVDTRSLAKELRYSGSMPGALACTSQPQLKFLDPNRELLVKKVSVPQKSRYKQGRRKVIAVDCGMKENILRSLLRFPIDLHRVPFDYDYTQEEYDGVFLSNGPGNPALCTATITILKKAMEAGKPIFGICLGTQILALAAGAKTLKLPFGHRGHNQPCMDTRTGQCYITSQNHGFAIDPRSLPSDWQVSFRNLNDDSVEGIAHRSQPFYAVQFHPEAAPGPTDTTWMFEKFYQDLQAHATP